MIQVQILNQVFSYTTKRSLIRSINLRLRSENSFSISCPILTPQFIIDKFIKDHSSWIIKNSVKYHTLKKIIDLKKITILDIDYQLQFVQSRHDSMVIYSDTNQIFINSSTFSESHLKNLFNLKLRPLALKLIKSRLNDFAESYNFKYGKVSVRNQTSRFGSCSHGGNLSFNWQIILFPASVFDHILLHELTHLAIKNHSSKFWNQLAIYDPKYKLHRFWLKKEASKFMIFS